MDKPCSGKIVVVALLAILMGSVLSAQAQDKPLKKIGWGVTSLSASNWIPWIAKDAKIYEKYGLDVELVLVKGSGQTSAAILGGSLFAAPVAVPQVMMANLGGADLVNIAHTVPGVQSKLLVKQEIRRPEDIKGKRIATSSLGSLGDFLFKYIIRKNGMDPIRDVIWLSIGTPPESGCRRWHRGGWMPRICPIPRTRRAYAWGIGFSGMRAKRSSIHPCRW